MTSESEATTVPDDYLHDDVQAVAEYRSVSLLAVFAAMLGVCSWVTLVSRGLLVIPLLGVILALLALWRIAGSEGQLAGRGAALVGLALSLAVGAGVFVHGVALHRLVAAEAEPWAIEWCELVMDGELQKALELKNSPDVRRALDDSLADYYETNEAAREALQAFRDAPVIQLLSNAAEGSRVEPGPVYGVAEDSQGFYVGQEFILVPPTGASNPSPVPFRLQLRRTRVNALGGGAWYLTDHVVGTRE